MVLDAPVCSSISADDAAKVGKYVCVQKVFTINLDWASAGSVQCHNFSLPAVDVEADLLYKSVKSLSLLLYVNGCVIVRLNRQRNPGLQSRRRVSI